MTAPQFVAIVRQYVPKDGVAHKGKPSRIKSKVKKALDKANIQNETIRGIGRRIGNYALVYEEKGPLLHANFVDFASLNVEVSKKARGSRSSKKKKVNVLMGPHSSVRDLSIKEFAEAIIKGFPEEWHRIYPTAYRWLSFDANFMYNSQQTVESSVQTIMNMANAVIVGQSQVYYTLISIEDNVLIGIGPA